MASFENSIKVDAPVDKVWTMLMNPASWGMWFPGADTVSGINTVQPGVSFTFQQGNDNGTGQIVEVDEGRGLIKVVTSDDGKQVTHTFDLDRTGGLFGMGGNDTSIKYRREYDTPGGIIGEFVVGGNPVDMLAVKRVLERFKRAVEG